MSDDFQFNNSRRKIELGKKGENIAVDFLEKSGYQILKTNYMIGHSDIDILARQNEYLVFVEVRTKSKDDNGMPEDSLTKKKLRRMRNTAELYIAFNHYDGLARLDAVCIVLDSSNNIKHIEHYEGVG
ncbi:MAG: YraN family protein [Spirochaetia bacterium]|jgi:putative endonuclease|nr:YraN family protein [Spirochaetia bacterium]